MISRRLSWHITVRSHPGSYTKNDGLVIGTPLRSSSLGTRPSNPYNQLEPQRGRGAALLIHALQQGLLVLSAALGAFAKQGFSPCPFPTDDRFENAHVIIVRSAQETVGQLLGGGVEGERGGSRQKDPLVVVQGRCQCRVPSHDCYGARC